jgi:hypothetical protein
MFEVIVVSLVIIVLSLGVYAKETMILELEELDESLEYTEKKQTPKS